MSHIGKNIRKIRTVKKLSQSAFADIFNLTRASIGAYEEGRAEPKIDTIVSIANYFSISVDSFISKELTINEIYNFDIFKEEFVNGKKSKSLIQQFIPLVKIHQYGEYCQKLESNDFIQTLDTIKIPIENPQKIRAFEHQGCEMHWEFGGIYHGDIIMTEKNELNDMFNTHGIYLIVLSNKILLRRLYKSGDVFDFRCDNNSSEPLVIGKDEIKEIRRIRGVYSTILNQPNLFEKRLLDIEDKYNHLIKQIKLMDNGQ